MRFKVKQAALLFFILILFLPGVSFSDDECHPEVFSETDTISVGYTVYYVSKSWWASELIFGYRYADPPDAKFLFVELIVKNKDKKERTIPPFKLVDENGYEYGSENVSHIYPGAISPLDNLNPGVAKRGVVIFDVPENRKYKLKVAGGYWTNACAFIQLKPEPEKNPLTEG